jgi:hypothetical protein
MQRYGGEAVRTPLAGCEYRPSASHAIVVQRAIKLDRARGATRRHQQHNVGPDIVIEFMPIKPHHSATVRPLAALI